MYARVHARVCVCVWRVCARRSMNRSSMNDGDKSDKVRIELNG